MLATSKYIAYKLYIMKLQDDSTQWSTFSMPPKCGPQFYFQWANHTNNRGKALPGLKIVKCQPVNI